MFRSTEINFISEKIKFKLKEKTRTRKWIESAVKKENCALGAMCYIFCSDEYLLEINKKYLKHNYLTDIITFDNSEQKGGVKKCISGDIFISIDRVKENARNLGITFDDELKRIMIHGILHLAGYSDKSEKHKKEMRKKEDAYINTF